jgi:hypothetical protein
VHAHGLVIDHLIARLERIRSCPSECQAYISFAYHEATCQIDVRLISSLTPRYLSLKKQTRIGERMVTSK